MKDFLSNYWPYLLADLERAVSILASAHAILKKRDTRSTIGWVGLIWLAPFVGSAFYFAFGVNRMRRRGEKLQEAIDKARQRVKFEIPEGDREVLEQAKKDHPNFRQFVRLMREVTGRQLLPRNRVVPLINGDEAYPAMLEAIREARQTISLETYIFDQDGIGAEFIEVLDEARKRGVELRVLIDDVGSRYSRPTAVKELKRRGIACRTFLPTRVPRLVQYANLRNHRKIMVVDGVTGFTGGMNIRDGCCTGREARNPIHDIHFRVEGPVVSHLQEAFITDWSFVTGEMLSGDDWQPKPGFAGEAWARGVPDGPDEEFENMLTTILGAIASAQESITIVNPYFLPDQSVIHALGVASKKGVDVRIVTPEKSNLRVFEWAATAMLPQVLETGCRVFLSPPPFDHGKLFIVDGAWLLFGSTNWDPRSLRLNFEFNVECYDFALAERMTEFAEEKIARSREATIAEITGRNLAVRLRDGVARLFTPYL